MVDRNSQSMVDGLEKENTPQIRKHGRRPLIEQRTEQEKVFVLFCFANFKDQAMELTTAHE